MLKYDEIWNDTVEEGLIKLYKSEELLKTDEILAGKLERLALVYYANYKKGDVSIIVDKINSVNFIVTSPNYFSSRHYSSELMHRVLSVMEDVKMLSKSIKVSLREIIKERNEEKENDLNYRSQRFENINTNRSNELYDQSTD